MNAREAFTLGVKDFHTAHADDPFSPLVTSWAWDAAWKRFEAAVERSRAEHGAEAFEAAFPLEGPDFARYCYSVAILDAAKDHNAIVGGHP